MEVILPPPHLSEGVDIIFAVKSSVSFQWVLSYGPTHNTTPLQESFYDVTGIRGHKRDSKSDDWIKNLRRKRKNGVKVNN